MEEYYHLSQTSKEISARLKSLREIIGASVDEEPGEYTLVEGEYVASIKRPVKFTWDKGILETIVGGVKMAGATVPNAVSAEIKVDKEKYEVLPAHEKALLSPALTVGPGPATIKITKKGEAEDDEDYSA